MRTTFLVFLGMTIYAFSGVAIEQKLSKSSTVAIEILYVVPMLVLTVIWLAIQTKVGTVTFPKGGALYLGMVLGAMYLVADYFYLSAYTSGGSVITISTIAVLAPVMTAIIRHIWVGGWPNRYQVAGYVLAAGAVLLMAKGGGSKT